VAEGTALKTSEKFAQIVVQISWRVPIRITRPAYATRDHHVAAINKPP
jgi:hypothetical protein